MKTSITFIKMFSALAILVLIALPGMQGMAQAPDASGSGGAAAPSDATTTLDIPAGQASAALAFWTHTELAKAKPLLIAVDKSTPNPRASKSADFSEPGGFAAPGNSATDADAIAKQVYAADWKAEDQTTPPNAMADMPAGTSQVFDSYIVNSWMPAQTIYPHKWVGRLSFSTSGGTSYCSATAISNNHFVTAAHCVYDTTNNKWYSKWVFTPAYRNGSAPYGSFAATSCTILTAWVNLSGSYSINPWTKYDVAVCKVGNNSSGNSLNYMVGWAGRAWNYGYTLHFFDMGYPWQDYHLYNLSNAGAYLRTCVAESRQYTTDILSMGCNYGPGISGGPWFLGYQQAALTGYVNSVNSGLFVNQQNMYGIRFNSNNIVPICNVQGC